MGAVRRKTSSLPPSVVRSIHDDREKAAVGMVPSAIGKAAGMLGDVNHFLIKSEEAEYPFSLLEKEGVFRWDGIRNYQATKNLRSMKMGQEIFFYHSNSKDAGIVGIAEICREAYPDLAAFDKKHRYYHAGSEGRESNPIWYQVDFRFVRKLKRLVSLKEIKERAPTDPILAGMSLVKQSRLSIQKVTDEQWAHILEMEKEEADD
eukprot:ANDGO_00654.mRNA.1 Uncharacterized protein C21.03c